MIVNETAKLENAPIPRLSSWAYPSSWSFSVSLRSAVDDDMPAPDDSSMCNPFPPTSGCNR